MVDIHSHILPQMDDGSASVEETVALLRMLKEQGAETVVATPHFYAWKDTLESFLARRQESVSKLPQDRDLPKVCIGAEVAYFDAMSHSQELEKLQIGQTGLLLIEMPFTSWTDRMVQEICALPFQVGLQPVLAHVNRYQGRNQMKKYGKILLENGVYFQCNADVFTQKSGCRWALKQLKLGNLHFLGSDCHNLTDRPPLLAQAKERIVKKLSDAPLNRMALLEKKYFP